MGRQNFIEINGKKYDALTGKLIQSSGSSSIAKKSVKLVANGIGVVDGFVKPPRRSDHRSAVHPANKSLQRSQTLMRKSVQKPSMITTSKIDSKPAFTKSKLGASIKRVQSAQEVKRSPQIQKYGQQSLRNTEIHAKPAGTKPQLITNKSISQLSKAPIESSKVAPSAPQRSMASRKLIEAAMANSNSHNEPQAKIIKAKKRSKIARKLGVSTRLVTVSSGALAVVLLFGFFAVQNVPNVSMKVASTRAGLDARMPGYRPSGFSFKGPINYSPGRVSVAYASNSDEREFEIVQSNSNWNSDALLSNFVVAEGKQYQTYQDRGRTLYIYDGSNATWVDNGIWYQIDGQSGMTTDQLIRIASSI